MADIAKYTPINGGNLVSDFKSHFSILTTTKTKTLAYAFFFVFIAFTIFLAFTPSSNSSSPWFTSIFTIPSTTNSTSSSPIFSLQSNGSHFPSIYGYFFPNSSSSPQSKNSSVPQNAGSANTSFLPQNFTEGGGPVHEDGVLKPTDDTKSSLNQRPTGENEVLKQNQTRIQDKGGVLKQNQTQIEDKGGVLKQNQTQIEDKGGVLKQNQTQIEDKGEVLKQNQTRIEDKVGVLKKNQTEIQDKGEVLKPNQSTNTSANGEKGAAERGLVNKPSNSKNVSVETNKGDELIKSLMNCDFFDGNWVKDESYPLYKPGSCSLIDEQFNCFLNDRPDNGYLKLKWKPKGCTLPRLDGGHMLEMLRGKRLVFVGDSLNRNMWESLICILRNSVKNKKKVYEEHGRHHFRQEASYSFIFEDYEFTVEFFVAPFLVQEWEGVRKDGTKKETLRLDLVTRAASKYKNADIIVFNTGHWWTHEKTSLGKDYYQEGSHVYNDLNVLEAFRKALTTWGRWVDANIDPKKSLVFFRGYSASHFSGGQWNSGGQCDHETEPIKNSTYLRPYPPKMSVVEKVLKGMKTRVSYLNITRMTDYRKDGHPSMYRRPHMSKEERTHFQDCSHWCLPGVPDTWNEILYAELLVKLAMKQQEKHS